MKYLKETAIVFIALVLVADFFLSYIWPAVYLKANSREYLISSTACSKALMSSKKAKGNPETFDSDLKSRLLEASQIELINCHKLSILKNKLLSNGVKKVDLKLLDLAALEDKNISLDQIVDRYEK
jgi:hypothetical protein